MQMQGVYEGVFMVARASSCPEIKAALARYEAEKSAGFKKIGELDRQYAHELSGLLPKDLPTQKLTPEQKRDQNVLMG